MWLTPTPLLQPSVPALAASAQPASALAAPNQPPSTQVRSFAAYTALGASGTRRESIMNGINARRARVSNLEGS